MTESLRCLYMEYYSSIILEFYTSQVISQSIIDSDDTSLADLPAHEEVVVFP